MADKNVELGCGNLTWVQIPPDDSQIFTNARSPVVIHFREVFGQQTVADANPYAVFFFLQLSSDRQEAAQGQHIGFWIFIEQALALTDQISHIGAVLGIVFVPAPI